MSFFRRLLIVGFALVLGLSLGKVSAQNDARTHFIYIQSDNQQPFYVILNKKSYSSSTVGYLIISKLIDGAYNITIGFPKDEFPAQTYALKINGNDAGFSLKKHSGEQTWDLIDKITQQELSVVGSGDVSSETMATAKPAETKSGFGEMLSKTSKDTTNYDAYRTPKTEPVKDTQTLVKVAETKKDTTLVAASTQKEVAVNNPVKNVKERPKTNASDDVNESYESASARSATESVIKIGERDDRRGVSLTFVVSKGEKIDTVSAFLPGDVRNDFVEKNDATNDSMRSENVASVSPEKVALKKEVDNRSTSENPFYKGSTQTNANTSKDLSLFGNDDKNNANSDKKESTNKDIKTESDLTNTSTKAATSKEIFNSTCSNMLSDKDVEKIRKKMIAKSSDEEMILVARKAIDTKCVYTAQVKQIGDLLLSDASRFSLYRLLYSNVYDGSQFSTLESQLLDKNYKAQFQALINKN